ncbi:MAG: PIG-L family deacetylase [Gemmatimonadota bacterium]
MPGPTTGCLLALTAHPDDETLGMGGTLAHYASRGVETHVVCATRGEAGRYRDGTGHPGPEALGGIREAELRAAADVLGVRSVSFLGYADGRLDQADPGEATARIVTHLRRLRPQVVVTFDPFGAYGHPDHIAICRLATSAVVRCADPGYGEGRPHAVEKLYYMVWPEPTWAAYQKAFKRLISRVDGVDRAAMPWPAWSISTRLDAREHWRTVWRAVRCHASQMVAYAGLERLSDADHRQLWGAQSFYRASGSGPVGRATEHDLFEGIPPSVSHA